MNAPDDMIRVANIPFPRQLNNLICLTVLMFTVVNTYQ